MVQSLGRAEGPSLSLILCVLHIVSISTKNKFIKTRNFFPQKRLGAIRFTKLFPILIIKQKIGAR